MKSHESDLMCMAISVYYDAIAMCTAVKPDLRDIKTLKSRVAHEGISFLTITLPSFCKDFERSLAQGAIDSTCFLGFKKYGAIPAFLRGMLSHVFDQSTGGVLDEIEGLDAVDIQCIRAIRQICLSFKKIEIDCEPERVRQSVERFVETERDLSTISVPETLVNDFVNVSRILYDNALSNVTLDDLRPKHGPGATAEGVQGNRKFSWQFWHERLEPYFPFIETAYPSVSVYGTKEFQNVTLLTEEQEMPVRVTLVPKTLKGPRIIAIEPCCMQYVQQAIRSELYNILERSYYTNGHINFRDQKN